MGFPKCVTLYAHMKYRCDYAKQENKTKIILFVPMNCFETFSPFLVLFL